MPAIAELGEGVFAFQGTPRNDIEYLLETVTEQGVREAAIAEVGERLDEYLEHELLLCGHTHMSKERCGCLTAL